jgi:hypothetical protein
MSPLIYRMELLLSDDHLVPNSQLSDTTPYQPIRLGLCLPTCGRCSAEAD